jgi:hypothetical protein
MRHLYTQRLAYLVTAVTLAAAVVFGAVASCDDPATDPGTQSSAPSVVTSSAANTG